MGVQILERIRDNYCDELKQFAEKGRVSMGDIETVNKLVGTIHYIDEIMDMDGGYSQTRGYTSRYDDGTSYGRHYVRGHYSRDGYSMTDGRMEVREHIHSMMNDPNMSHADREALRRAEEELR